MPQLPHPPTTEKKVREGGGCNVCLKSCLNVPDWFLRAFFRQFDDLRFWRVLSQLSIARCTVILRTLQRYHYLGIHRPLGNSRDYSLKSPVSFSAQPLRYSAGR